LEPDGYTGEDGQHDECRKRQADVERHQDGNDAGATDEARHRQQQALL